MNKYAFWINLSTVMTMACGSSSTSVGLELDASSHDTQSDVRDTSLEAWSEPDAKVETDTSSHDSWVPETLQEASSDTQGADASADTEKSCATGQKECRGYKLYQCVAQNTWEYQRGTQDCCTTNGRFEIRKDNTIFDTKTGLIWLNGISIDCSLLPKSDSGAWRTPTLEELRDIVIGKADLIDGKYYVVCSPTLDQKAWGSGRDGPTIRTITPSTAGKYWGINLSIGYEVEVDPTKTVTFCVR